MLLCHSFLGVHFIMLLSFLCRLSLPTSDLPKWSITAIKDMRGLKRGKFFLKTKNLLNGETAIRFTHKTPQEQEVAHDNTVPVLDLLLWLV